MRRKQLTEEERKRKNALKAKSYYEKHKNDPAFKAKIAERNKRARERLDQKKLVIQEKPKVEPVPEDLPAESVEKHPKHTVIICQGWEPENGKTVIVERWVVEGFPVFRVKTVICRHYKTKAKAILAARSQVARLKQYNDLIDPEETERR